MRKNPKKSNSILSLIYGILYGNWVCKNLRLTKNFGIRKNNVCLKNDLGCNLVVNPTVFSAQPVVFSPKRLKPKNYNRKDGLFAEYDESFIIRQ